MKMKRIGMLGAAVLAAGFLWADDPAPQATPGIALHRAQQRYPWNGKVDIDYTVSNVVAGTESQYFVRFKITENNNTHVLHEFINEGTLVDASNGTYRVTWDSAAETDSKPYQFFDKNATVLAELVYCGDDKSSLPYGTAYLIIDLTGGSSATKYPVSYEYIRDQETANARFNDGNFKTNCLVLRRVRAGTFTMGSPASGTAESSVRESDSWLNKETQHQVTLSKDFLLGIFPVTQTQYEKVMGTNPAMFTTDAPGNFAAERPVEQVTYPMIRGRSAGVESPAYGNYDKGTSGDDSFLGRLERCTGLTFDLPTEAQWEYACRAGTTNCTYIGDYTTEVSILGTIAWYGVNASSITHGVGQKQPNAWGFYDMLGNVWEFCRDRVTPSPDDDWGTSAVTDPLRAVSGGNVSVRGSALNFGAKYTRVACRRGADSILNTYFYYGFRLSRLLP